VHLCAFEAIQKSIESLPNISKATLFSKNAREFQYIHRPIGKRAQKIRERIQPIVKKNQSADALAFF